LDTDKGHVAKEIGSRLRLDAMMKMVVEGAAPGKVVVLKLVAALCYIPRPEVG
jgi:hypothetical protein